MSPSYLELDACEAGFHASPFPVWIFDINYGQIIWINDAGLELWRATERSELFDREFLANAPEHIREHSRQLIKRALAGERLSADWTIFPKGEAVTVSVTLQCIRMRDGHPALLHQAVSLDNNAAVVQRNMAMLRHSTTISVLVDAQGKLLNHNAAAARVFGERPWLEWFCERSEGELLLATTLAGSQTRVQRARVVVGEQQRWHTIIANPLRDPVSASVVGLFEHRDETERIEALILASERERDIDRLTTALELVERQRAEILSLSAPILDVGQATLAVPLIGSFDTERSEALTTALLEAVSARGVRRVIVDLTGLAEVDVALAQRIEALVRCLELLGVRPIITGIRPELARTFTYEGLSLEHVPTLRSLAAGLAARG